MFCGNYQKAKDEIYEAIFKGIKVGWSAGRPQSWTWTSNSERALLEEIKHKTSNVTEKVLVNFEELPVNFCGWVPERSNASFPLDKILTMALDELDSFWSNTSRSIYVDRRIGSIKREIKNELQKLDAAWRFDEEKREVITRSEDYYKYR